jgi:hypothetical protein
VRAVLHVLGLPGGSAAWSELEQLARDTGGDLVRPTRNPADSADRLGLALSGSYVLEVESTPADRAGKPRPLRVAVRRKNLIVRSPRAWLPQADAALAVPVAPVADRRDTGPPPAVKPAVPANAEEPAAPPPGEPSLPSLTGGRDPELDRVLARAVEYVRGYRRDFANVVAEEDYVQTVTRNQATTTGEIRHLKSDFLMVTAADGTPWIPFRDVFELDGTRVRDRDDRLRKLFLDKPDAAMDQALRIRMEGARYNLGSVTRTVNVPTQPLFFLFPQTVAGFRFHRGGQEAIDAVRVWRVDFEETSRPTFIRGREGTDVPASGSFWIDPLTGRILKTQLRARHPGFTPDAPALLMETTVRYRRNDALGLWVPVDMRETYRSKGEWIDATAKYANFRTFQVRTEETIKIPK